MSKSITDSLRKRRAILFKINGNYAGFGVCDAWIEKENPLNCLAEFIIKYVKACGFEDVVDYLGLIPGYVGDETANLFPVSVQEKSERLSIMYESRMTDQRCGFDFEYVIKELETNNELLLSMVSTAIEVIMIGYDYLPKNPMFVIVPTLEELRPLFYNVPDEKLWFCKEVLEGT